MKFDRTWWMAMLGSFVATVLGIAVTFGVSKAIDNKQAAKMQRNAVFSVITDIDQFMSSMRRDSMYFCSMATWLPRYVEMHAESKPAPADSAYAYFFTYFSYKSDFNLRYKPVGKTMIDNSNPRAERDMELYRLIGIAYNNMDDFKSLMEGIEIYTDKLVDITNSLKYENEIYDEKAIVKRFLEAPESHALANTLTVMSQSNWISSYMYAIQMHRGRIMKFAGITQEDYDKFLADISDGME